MIDSTIFPKGKDSDLVEVINEKAVVAVNISTGFYKRIQGLLSTFLEGKTQEQIQQMHSKIQNKAVDTAEVFHYETLLILCKEFETNAKTQGFVDKITIEEFKKKINQAAV